MELTDSVAERHVGPPTPGIEPVSLGGFFFFFFGPSLQFIGRDRSNPGGKGCRWLAKENVNRCRSIERKQKAWIAR